MNMAAQPKLLGLPPDLAQKLGRAGVGSMRAKPGADAPSKGAVPLLGKSGGLLDLVSAAILAKHRPGKLAAQSAAGDRLGDLIHGKIMIGDGGDPSLDQFGGR